MAKKFTFIMIVLLIISACVFVSCKQEPEESAGSKERWSATYTETYKEDDKTYTATSTMTLMFDGKGKLTVIINIDTLLEDGVDITDDLPEEVGTITLTGTYTAISDVQGTFSYVGEDDQTISGNYAIQGSKLMLSADGKSTMFTRK